VPRETVTSSTRAALYAQQTGEVLLWLLTLTHHTFADPIRVVNDGQDQVSRGDTFRRFPFEISIEGEGEKTVPRAVLRICNVDRSIVEACRSVEPSGAIGVTAELIAASDPDHVEAGPMEFSLREVGYDALVVEGELRYEDVLSEPYPKDTFSPSRFPAVFR
jgi:hypothetical protein